MYVLIYHCQQPSNFKDPPVGSMERDAIQKNALQAESDILGIANNAAGRAGITKSTLQHPAVFGLFARWLEDNTKFDQPFPFTTISMTHGQHPSIQYFLLNCACVM